MAFKREIKMLWTCDADGRKGDNFKKQYTQKQGKITKRKTKNQMNRPNQKGKGENGKGEQRCLEISL